MHTKVRIVKGDKKRPVVVMRPTLKKLNSTVGRCEKVLRSLRGALRRAPLEARQAIKARMHPVQVEKEKVIRYVAALQS